MLQKRRLLFLEFAMLLIAGGQKRCETFRLILLTIPAQLNLSVTMIPEMVSKLLLSTGHPKLLHPNELDELDVQDQVTVTDYTLQRYSSITLISSLFLKSNGYRLKVLFSR